MFPIKNKEDLRVAYDLLQVLKRYKKPVEMQTETKRAIREYAHKKKPFECIVKEYGIDGYVLLIELPDFLKRKEDAEEYFEERYVIHATPSVYDCTGQAFTSWYKIFKRRNRFYAYHSVCFDV